MFLKTSNPQCSIMGKIVSLDEFRKRKQDLGGIMQEPGSVSNKIDLCRRMMQESESVFDKLYDRRIELHSKKMNDFTCMYVSGAATFLAGNQLVQETMVKGNSFDWSENGYFLPAALSGMAFLFAYTIRYLRTRNEYRRNSEDIGKSQEELKRA